MKFIKTVIFALFSTFYLCVQAQNFTSIDEHARSVPFPKDQNIHQLTTALSEGCQSEKEKVRAYYVWVCENIKYDVKTFENRNDIDPEKRRALGEPENVLKNKKGVCEGYSNLFVAMCKASGIEALKVAGVSKNAAGNVSRGGHAWCLVRTDGEWGLLDATWGAGDVDIDAGKYQKNFKEKYFLSSPETMILNHFPNDPLFQMLPNPLTSDEFKEKNLPSLLAQKSSAAPRAGYTHIPDSLNVFVRLDSVETLRSAGLRMLEMDPESNVALYTMSQYHFQTAYNSIRSYSEERAALQKTPKKMTAAWYDQQLAKMNAAKAQLEKALEISAHSAGNDQYSTGIRSLRRNADTWINFLEKDLEQTKKNRSRIN